MRDIIESWSDNSCAFILDALQSISKDVYEAAEVDGATKLQTFFKITHPLLKPTILTSVVLQSMEYFNMVTLIYTLTSGGPFDATQTVSVLVFKEVLITGICDMDLQAVS